MPETSASNPEPGDALLLNASDNVAIARDNLPSGVTVRVRGVSIRTVSRVPAGHKLAIRRLALGEPVIRYGEEIGVASRDVECGEHLHTHNLSVRHLTAQPLPSPSAEPQPSATGRDAELKGRTFLGYERPDGRAGTRNYIAVVAASNCSAHATALIASHFQDRELRQGVDGVAAFPHSEGCGHSIGRDTEQLQRTISGLLHHPNVAGAVIVGLGCEVNQIDYYLASAPEAPITGLTLQCSGGTSGTVAAGIAAVEQHMERASQMRRVPLPVSQLVLGLNCGGSDAFSGITANPALGVCSNLLIRAGGTTVLAETPEIFGAEHLLLRRATNARVGERLLEVIAEYKNYLRRSGADFNDNPSPGNKEGGLSNIVEKSLGAVAKGGSSPLMDVLEYAERVRCTGLVYMNTPGYDPVSITGLAAGGANLIAFTTGRGSAIGFPTVPVVKIATNTPLFASMRENMDVNAGGILDGQLTLEKAGALIFEFVLEVASGRRTAAERLGHAEFVPWRIGPVL